MFMEVFDTCSTFQIKSLIITDPRSVNLLLFRFSNPYHFQDSFSLESWNGYVSYCRKRVFLQAWSIKDWLQGLWTFFHNRFREWLLLDYQMFKKRQKWFRFLWNISNNYKISLNLQAEYFSLIFHGQVTIKINQVKDETSKTSFWKTEKNMKKTVSFHCLEDPKKN